MQKADVSRDTLDLMKFAREDMAESGAYDYDSYRVCAVGHVFKAVVGHFAEGGGEVTDSGMPEFRKVMASINSVIAPREHSDTTPLSRKAHRGNSDRSEVEAGQHALTVVINDIEAAHFQELIQEERVLELV